MIDRAQFLPRENKNTYGPFPLSDSCTVPTEEAVSLLADLLGDAKDVLEIGTGSGYQTAVLAERFRSVVSIEVEPIPGLPEKLPDNVALIVANGYEYDTGEQFDAVLVTFASDYLADAWANQTKEDGLLVVPLKIGATCRVSVYRRKGTRMNLIDSVFYANFTPGVTPCESH